MAVCTLENVTVRYGALTALDRVSLSVDEGEFLCVAGSNGSGKSTLLKAAIGLAPVESGHVVLNGSVGYAPQAGSATEAERMFPATVREVVLTGTQRPRHFFMSRNDREAAEKALGDFGLTDLADRMIGELSGGQVQRVFLARALCAPHELLLLDEPCAGLDPSMRRILYDMLLRLSKNGTAVVMVTHELGELASMGEAKSTSCRVVMMEHGQIGI